MARYYEEETLFQSAKDGLLKYFSDSFVYTSAELFHKVLTNTPTADVVPKSEVLNILSDLKKQIHDKAVYTNSQDVPNYINLKVFDAILNKYVQRCSDE